MLIGITGQRFGKLVALEYVGKERWRTICDCGNEYVVYGRSLRRGFTFEEIFYKGKFPNRGRKTIKIRAT